MFLKHDFKMLTYSPQDKKSCFFIYFYIPLILIIVCGNLDDHNCFLLLLLF